GTSLAASIAVWIAAIIALLLAETGPVSAPPQRWTEQRPSLFFPLRFDAGYRPPWRLLLVSFGTGCVFLALEVIWFRFLRLYVASSMTAFAVMLAVVLAGIGFGGIVAGAIHRRSSRLHCLVPVLLLLSAVLVLVSYLLFPGELIPAPTGVFDLSWWQIALVGVALMFPAALISGMLFPSIVTEVQARVSDRMNSTGIATLCNTTGAAVGPLLAGFVLLPGIGFQSSIIICVASYALLSILVTERDLLRFVR